MHHGVDLDVKVIKRVGQGVREYTKLDGQVKSSCTVCEGRKNECQVTQAATTERSGRKTALVRKTSPSWGGVAKADGFLGVGRAGSSLSLMVDMSPPLILVISFSTSASRV